MVEYRSLGHAATNFVSRPAVRTVTTTGATLLTFLGAAGEAAASDFGPAANANPYLLAAGVVAAGGAALAAFLVWYNNRSIRHS